VRFVASRLRPAEWLIGAAALALALDASLLPWFGSENAWQALRFTRYVIAVAILGGLASWWLQGTRRSPAMPICATVTTLSLCTLALIALVWCVLIDTPGSGHVRAGAYVGLVFSAALTAATYRSVRLDGIRDADGPGEIERLAVPPASPRPDPAL